MSKMCRKLTMFVNTTLLLSKSGVETLSHSVEIHYNYASFLKEQG